MPKAYYNEIDPYCVQWLKNLIAAGHIADGDVDNRPIHKVSPGDLDGYTQCHFFAGIGGWSYALRLAGWPDDREVWTGSCPCQPFSVAGRGRGNLDERHLWPCWRDLISESAPEIIFGEQVRNAISKGWLDKVFGDLEDLSYSNEARVLPAAYRGHDRKRLYFVAHSIRERLERFKQQGIGLCGVESKASTIGSNRGVYERVYYQPDLLSVRRLNGISRPVGIVRAFGNAIVPQAAAEFIGAYLECLSY